MADGKTKKISYLCTKERHTEISVAVAGAGSKFQSLLEKFFTDWLAAQKFGTAPPAEGDSSGKKQAKINIESASSFSTIPLQLPDDWPPEKVREFMKCVTQLIEVYAIGNNRWIELVKGDLEWSAERALIQRGADGHQPAKGKPRKKGPDKQAGTG